MISTGTKVRVRKTGAVENPKFETMAWADYVPGADNQASPPVEYEVVGTVVFFEIAEGNCITLAREERNGEKVAGLFRSSTIQKIAPGEKEGVQWIAATHNSIYLIELV